MKKIDFKKILTTSMFAVTSFMLFGVNVPTIVKVQKEPVKILKDLTDAQKDAVAWADVAAGLTSAETGPASLLIAAATSMYVYKAYVAENGKLIASGGFNPKSNPITSNNYGEIHNQICLTYYNLNINTINFADVVSAGILAKPDLKSEFNSLSEQVFNEKVNWAKAQDLSTTQKQLDLILSIITLNQNDIITVRSSLEQIQNSSTITEHTNSVNAFIGLIPTFDTQESNKVKLTNAFEILKHSYILWAQ